MGRRSTAAAAATAAAALLGLSASAGCGEATPERAASGEAARTLDETTATFEGVRLSATSQRIRRRFGRPLKSPDGAATPPGVDFYDVGGPTNVQPPRCCPAPRTAEAAGRCATQRRRGWSRAAEGTEYTTFPLCEAEVRPGVRLYFGGDPVKSIWLIVTGDAAYRKLRSTR